MTPDPNSSASQSSEAATLLLTGSAMSVAATPPPGAAAEVAFISGVTSSNQVAATSFWTWNSDNPATYSTTSNAVKWGSSTPGTSGGTVTYWFDTASNWSLTEKNALISGLALWSAEANIAFSLAANATSANFIFYRGHDGSAFEDSNSTTTTVGSGSTGSFLSTGTRISIDTSVAGFGPIGGSFSTYGGYPYQTLVHEEGHLIGLGHDGPYNGNVNPANQQFSAYDSRLWSLMSYINPWDTRASYYGSYPVTGTNWGTSPDGSAYEPTTPMILDILAAQQLYGAATSGPLAGGGQIFGFNSNIGGSISNYFNFTVNTHPVITIWDGGSNNTLDLSGWSTPATINLNPGTFSSANGEVNNIGIAEGTIIQTAIGGTGNDTFTVNSYNDTIDGRGGTNTVVFSGARAQYQVTKRINASFQIVDLRSGSPDGTDEISNVQLFKFTDVTDTFANPPPPAGTTAYMIMSNPGTGAYEIYNIGGNAVLAAYFLGQAAPPWAFVAFGTFRAGDMADMLLRNTSTGAFQASYVSGNSIVGATQLGAVGTEWNFAGIGNFDGTSTLSELMLRNGSSGAFELYRVVGGGVLSGNSAGSVGNNFQVKGFGFFSASSTQMLMQDNSGDASNGQFELYTYQPSSASLAGINVGRVGSNLNFIGSADLLGNGATQIVMQQNNGTFWLYTYSASTNTLSGQSVGAVGSNFHVVGFGPLGMPSQDEMLMQDASGNFEVYQYNAGLNSFVGSAMGTVGAPWVVEGIAAAPATGSTGSSGAPLGSTAQIVQAMASFDAPGAADSAPLTVVGGADPSPQTLLTTPHSA
jgi:Peptidase M10 serralysin C terminal